MRRLFCIWVVLFFVSCRSSKVAPSVPSRPPAYSLIYVLHGDANYLYHNAEGNPLQADERMLKEAKKVARHALHGEVFIFHQKPEQKILWFFPKKDRHFLYYRNGNLIRRKGYSPHSSNQSFVTESALYHQYTHLEKSAGQKVFLYFGHEVPEHSDYPYYYSRPNVAFDTSIFARGVQLFIKPEESPFNLIVLSTCNNGTPSMVQALTPYARYLLASPQNLHLSHIDTGQLANLLEQPDLIMRQIADSMATHTYQRLASFLQTSITLSLYDTHQTAAYLPDLAQSYATYLMQLSSINLLDDNNTDCNRLSFFQMTVDTLGIKKWYKAPRFGNKRGLKTKYSGWGCK